MNEIYIDGRSIGQQHVPFVIAELSGNHGQSFDYAKSMIDAAAEAGAHAIKLQTYTADTMTLACELPDFQIDEQNNLWKGQSLHTLYQQAYTPWEWHEALFGYAKSKGLIAFSSPFDISAVDFLETLDVPCYKIASFENNDLPLIKRIAQTGKPVIMSTGMASLTEISEAVDTLRTNGCSDFVLLKCTSAYPALASEANLATITHLANTFNCPVGLSDHTLGLGVALASVPLGACVIEKHFVLSRDHGGVDAAFSLEPEELAMLVRESKRAFEAVGMVTYGGTVIEQDSKKYRRSIYISKDVKKGDILSAENLRIVRPGFGLAPKYWQQVLGSRVTKDATLGTALTWEHIK
ncbi:pseudaminic acid synthase [Thalassotalea marina]|uniref:Pseudaminic acid synthase n=1 Tax=Thalassotalea marina TaxID=1673741 RepID=A0A919BCZ9_9GAMM|nr:pseudaminic acid synthase [Thalassotalea marina]GHF80355.1 pseudaminic acid synthase [Thalassotalea marina]